MKPTPSPTPFGAARQDDPPAGISVDPGLVVLLDAAGRAVGTAARATVHDGDTPLHLAFSCYAVDPHDRLLVTRRALTKLTFPGLWTNTVCGHPAPGESLADAVRRRARDELGLVLGGLRLVLPDYAYRAEMNGVVEHEMCPVFLAALDEDVPVRPNPAEVAAVRRLPWADVVALAAEPPPGWSPWAMEQVRRLTALGPSPRDWPTGASDLLPPAARPAGPARPAGSSASADDA